MKANAFEIVSPVRSDLSWLRAADALGKLPPNFHPSAEGLRCYYTTGETIILRIRKGGLGGQTMDGHFKVCGLWDGPPSSAEILLKLRVANENTARFVGQDVDVIEGVRYDALKRSGEFRPQPDLTDIGQFGRHVQACLGTRFKGPQSGAACLATGNLAAAMYQIAEAMKMLAPDEDGCTHEDKVPGLLECLVDPRLSPIMGAIINCRDTSDTEGVPQASER